MAKNKVILSTRWTDDVMSALEQNYDVFCPPKGKHLTKKESLTALKGADAFCPVFYDKLDGDFLSNLPKSVKIIASCGVGTDHIDLTKTQKLGIPVTNTPDVLTEETADLTLGLMLSTARRFYEREKSLRAGNWKGPKVADDLGIRMYGKKLGIIGLGRIGLAVAKRAKAFGMDVFYYSRTPKPKAEKELGLKKYNDLETLFRESDFISLHCPLTRKTKHIIDKAALSLMKPDTIIINTGRGPLIDETALVKALQNQSIAGAGLDVFEFEPKITEGLTDLENVTLLPHIGSATLETRNAMGFKVLENLDHFFAGNPLPNLVKE